MLLPVTVACILFNAVVSSVPSIFMQNVIAAVEQSWQSGDWSAVSGRILGLVALLAVFYVLSLAAGVVYTQLMAVITLEPGESVGVHPHTSNGEAYFILEGGATMTEDDETRILGVGDAEFCADGHTHSIKNHTDKPMRFLAVIFPNK